MVVKVYKGYNNRKNENKYCTVSSSHLKYQKRKTVHTEKWKYGHEMHDNTMAQFI